MANHCANCAVFTMSVPASNGVPAGTTGAAAPEAVSNQEYNPHHLVGSLIDEEEEPIPLLYFTSIPEAWVSISNLCMGLESMHGPMSFSLVQSLFKRLQCVDFCQFAQKKS